MDIGKRLRQLRIAKNLSQGAVEARTGLACSYISRVENGHKVPGLESLARWAKALDVKLYELFFEGDGTPQPLRVKGAPRLTPWEKNLFQLIKRMKQSDRRLLLHLAQDMFRQKDIRE